MKRNEILRHLAGYLFGGITFLVLIPLLLRMLSRLEAHHLGCSLGLPEAARLWLSIPLGALGLIFAAWSNIFLFDIGKGGPAEGLGIAISPKTQKLVTSGPYKYSRNPMVFGALTLYLSFSVYFNSLVCIILVILLASCVGFYLRKYEEERLLRDFGEEYLAYKKKVPMLIPFLRSKKNNPGG
jgi:protein-S-isoprenylcysteine O-methyltransferase Ste14